MLQLAMKVIFIVSAIDVWLEYVQFSIGLIGDGNQMENVRSILERAVSLCGLNAAKGSLLWELYREFEKIVLVSVMVSVLDCNSLPFLIIKIYEINYFPSKKNISTLERVCYPLNFCMRIICFSSYLYQRKHLVDSKTISIFEMMDLNLVI